MKKLGIAFSYILIAAGLVNCGAKAPSGPGYGTDQLNSQQPLPVPPIAQDLQADCNGFSSTQNSGRIQVYPGHYDAFRVRLSQISGDLLTDPEASLQFFSWSADDSSVSELSAVNFYLEDATVNPPRPITGNLQSFSQIDLNIFSQHYGYNSDMSTFLTRVNIVLTNVSAEADALKLVVYSDRQALSQVDFLIPGFVADPNLYAADHPPILSGLHPNNIRKDQGLDVSELWSYTARSCF